MSTTPDRILDGAAEAVTRLGLRKTTVEDIATAAGVSRATVYRWFRGGRDEVFDALTDREVVRFLVGVRDAVAGSADLGELLADGLQAGVRALADHDLFQATLRTDQDELIVRLDGSNARMLQLVTGFLRTEISRLRPSEAEPDALADWLARMVLSYLGHPGSWDLDDRAQVEELVRTQFLPG